MQETDTSSEKRYAMMLKDWDIWYSYTNYFIEDFNRLDLKNLAELLVQSNLCAVVYHSDNLIWWSDGKEIKNTKIEFKNLGDERWQYSFNIKESNLNVKSYSFEGANQAAKMRISELNLFSPRYLNIFSYIRGYLNACYMSINGRIVVLYPQIKIYNNGVFLLSFRIIAHKNHIEYPIDTFIKYDINLYRYKADYIEVPPEWLKLHIRDLLLWSEGSIISRYKVLHTINEINSNIDSKIREINDGDFKFYVSHLEGSGDYIFFDKDNFDGIKDMVTSSLFNIINPTNDGTKYIIKGPGNEKYHVGDISVSRPSIYILEFADQPDSSKEIIEKFSNEIGQIMSRTSCKGDFSKLSEPNLRPLFDDYTLHINQALTLWVLSKKGLNANKDNIDINRGHLIYEKQVLEESINYMYTCYRRYAERSYLANISYSSSINEQLDIIKLRDTIRHSCYAGELDDFHAHAANAFKLSDIFENSMANLKLKAELIQTQRNESLIKLGFAISVLFGLGSLPSFANEIIKPISKFFDLWLPDDVISQQLFFIIIAFIIIFLILFTLWRSKDLNKVLKEK